MVSLEDLASPLVSRAALAFLPIVIFSYVSLRNKQNMTKNTDTPKRTIVVVGGGAAGSNRVYPPLRLIHFKGVNRTL